MICTLSLPDSSWISKLHSCWAVRSSASTVISTVALFFWYLPLSSRCFCNLKEFFRLLSCRYDNFGMLVLLLVKCLPRMSFMELVVSKMQCMKPEMKPEIIKTRVTATKPKKIQIGPFLSLKWLIYKYVRVRAVRFWFLTILIQQNSFYTQNFFGFSYFKNIKK